MAECIMSRERRYSAGLSSGGRNGTGQKAICSASALDWNDATCVGLCRHSTIPFAASPRRNRVVVFRRRGASFNPPARDSVTAAAARRACAGDSSPLADQAFSGNTSHRRRQTSQVDQPSASYRSDLPPDSLSRIDRPAWEHRVSCTSFWRFSFRRLWHELRPYFDSPANNRPVVHCSEDANSELGTDRSIPAPPMPKAELHASHEQSLTRQSSSRNYSGSFRCAYRRGLIQKRIFR